MINFRIGRDTTRTALHCQGPGVVLFGIKGEHEAKLPPRGGHIQVPSATELETADQYCTKSNTPSGRNSSAGAFQPRVFLGRVLSSHAMSSSFSWENTDRSVPLGRYWRSSPLVFSEMPRSQGARGWAKYTSTPVFCVSSLWWRISEPWS